MKMNKLVFTFCFRYFLTSGWVSEDLSPIPTTVTVQWSRNRALWEVEIPGLQAMTGDIIQAGL